MLPLLSAVLHTLINRGELHHAAGQHDGFLLGWSFRFIRRRISASAAGQHDDFLHLPQDSTALPERCCFGSSQDERASEGAAQLLQPEEEGGAALC